MLTDDEWIDLVAPTLEDLFPTDEINIVIGGDDMTREMDVWIGSKHCGARWNLAQQDVQQFDIRDRIISDIIDEYRRVQPGPR